MSIFPLVLIHEISSYPLSFSSPFLLPFSLLFPLSSLPYTNVCMHKCIHLIIHLCECAYVHLCVCAWPSHSRKPSASHLWHSQQPRKQAPPPANAQQPMGGLVWDYLGTWVAGGPVGRLDSCTAKLTRLFETRHKTTFKALVTMWKSHIS